MSEFSGEGQPQEIVEKKPATRSSLEVGETRATLVKKKSDYPGFVRVEITFGDIYRGELVSRFGWSEDQIESLDMQLFSKLREKGVIINWEDREFFVIDIPEAATSDPIMDVEAALQATLGSPLSDQSEIEDAKKLHEELADNQEELARQERAKVRTEESLFRAYKTKPNPRNSADHDGYCSINKVKIKKVSGINYGDNEFLGTEYRKKATDPSMVILSVSVNGEPFDRIYEGRIIKEKSYGFGEYDSKLLEIIQGLKDPEKDEISKISYRVSTIRNRDEADGEEVKMLCTEDFVSKVAEHIKALYSDLEDYSDEDN